MSQDPRPAAPAALALVAGAVLMASATAVGALGAHALRDHLTPDRYAVLQTAVLYQFINALGLLLIGAVLTRRVDRGLRLARNLLLTGVLLFSGSLYLLLAGAPRVVGLLTPLGGLCLIAGWCVAALGWWRGMNPAVQ
jgi:uncharacterized membrane protein YgdD (TMEM256/DUF423 family)